MTLRRPGSVEPIPIGQAVQVVPVNKDGKIILLFEENVPLEEARIMLEQIERFLNDPLSRACIFWGGQLQVIKVEEVKQVEGPKPGTFPEVDG